MVAINLICRLNVNKVKEDQVSMEKKGIAVFFVCLVFGVMALMRLCIDILMSVYLPFSFQTAEKPGKFCQNNSSWLFLLVSNTIIILILSL